MRIEQNNYCLDHVTLPETEKKNWCWKECKRPIVSSQLIVSGSEEEFLATNKLSSPLLLKRSQYFSLYQNISVSGPRKQQNRK